MRTSVRPCRSSSRRAKSKALRGDAGVDLRPLGIGRAHAPRGPAGDRDARNAVTRQDVGQETTHRFVVLPPWKRVEYIPASVKARLGADEEALAALLRVGAASSQQHVRRGPGRDAMRRPAWPAGPPAARRPAPALPGPSRLPATRRAAARPSACRRCPGSDGRRGRAVAARRSWSTLPARAAARGPAGRATSAGLRQSSQPSARWNGLIRVACFGSCGSVCSGPLAHALQLWRHDLGGQRREPGLELGRGLTAVERDRPLGHDRPGVELRRS